MQVLLRILLLVAAFRLIGGIFGWFRPPARRARAPRGGTRPTEGGREPSPSADGADDYQTLTPYEIEDADFEELPRREG